MPNVEKIVVYTSAPARENLGHFSFDKFKVACLNYTPFCYIEFDYIKKASF